MNDASEDVELFRKYRPDKFAGVLGQEDAVAQLHEFVKRGTTPHAVLFTGPSGVGKTTLARILARKLGCAPADLDEVNAAEDRGIDMARSIQRRMGLAPMAGKVRVWVLDEVHRATGEAQTALLKTLEDTPRHVYFVLCTTNPEKILLTIRNRCTEIRLASLGQGDLVKLVRVVLAAERAVLNDDVIDKLADVADGSARKALVLLHQIIGLPGEDEQLEVLEKTDRRRAAFDLVKALLWEKTNWEKICTIVNGLDENEDWEGLRRMVLAVAGKQALKPGKPNRRALAVLDAFKYNYFDTGKWGLVLSCSELFKS